MRNIEETWELEADDLVQAADILKRLWQAADIFNIIQAGSHWHNCGFL